MLVISKLNFDISSTAILIAFYLCDKLLEVLKQYYNSNNAIRIVVYPVCVGPATDCMRHMCGNGGTCVQQWNSYTCDCHMTSFTGRQCDVGECYKE